MGEQLKKNLHIVIRLAIVISFLICTSSGFENSERTGVPYWLLLSVSCFFSLAVVGEIVRNKLLPLVGEVIFAVLLYCYGAPEFILLFWYLSFEILSFFGAGFVLYFLPYLFVFAGGPFDPVITLTVITLLMASYLEYEFGIRPYREQVLEETVASQGLKKELAMQEDLAKAELKKSMLKAENSILEERAGLSQALHDKLGHSINGSIYQLEACKLLIEKEPEKTKTMIQSVIDQLRSGMDEIRAILRKERPDKKQMALLQLYELCEDCNNKGVEAELITEGDVGVISSDIWEVLLDNSFEAVSNAMKYSGCKHIKISIVVLNRMLKCTISDDGKGCSTIVPGMGLSGMKQRIRNIGGTIDFKPFPGFTINMLISL